MKTEEISKMAGLCEQSWWKLEITKKRRRNLISCKFLKRPASCFITRPGTHFTQKVIFLVDKSSCVAFEDFFLGQIFVQVALFILISIFASPFWCTIFMKLASNLGGTCVVSIFTGSSRQVKSCCLSPAKLEVHSQNYCAGHGVCK